MSISLTVNQTGQVTLTGNEPDGVTLSINETQEIDTTLTVPASFALTIAPEIITTAVNEPASYDLAITNPIITFSINSGNEASDTDAIHDNVASEISAITEKTNVVNADMILIEDSEDSNSKKMVQFSNVLDGGRF